jgi:hypothetical protein
MSRFQCAEAGRPARTSTDPPFAKGAPTKESEWTPVRLRTPWSPPDSQNRRWGTLKKNCKGHGEILRFAQDDSVRQRQNPMLRKRARHSPRQAGSPQRASGGQAWGTRNSRGDSRSLPAAGRPHRHPATTAGWVPFAKALPSALLRASRAAG